MTTNQSTTHRETQTATETSDGIDRLDFASLQVRDLDRARAFYEGFLGFDVLPAMRPDAVVFKTSTGAAFAVREPLIDLEASPKLGWGVSLWFGAGDVDSVHERAVAEGVEIVSEPAPSPFGRVLTLRDPDGYAVTLHNVPRQENGS